MNDECHETDTLDITLEIAMVERSRDEVEEVSEGALPEGKRGLDV